MCCATEKNDEHAVDNANLDDVEKGTDRCLLVCCVSFMWVCVCMCVPCVCVCVYKHTVFVCLCLCLCLCLYLYVISHTHTVKDKKGIIDHYIYIYIYINYGMIVSKAYYAYYQAFFWVLIDLIVELLGLIIKTFDNQTES
jgi:hypothetical protein